MPSIVVWAFVIVFTVAVSAIPKGYQQRAVLQRHAIASYFESIAKSEFDNVPKDNRHGAAELLFDHFVRKLSVAMKQSGAVLYFVSIGACDGSHDETIDQFANSNHWLGVFVEPMKKNIEDLNAMLARASSLDRSTILTAAATDVCSGPTIKYSMAASS